MPLFEDPAGRKSRHTLTNCLIDFIFRMPANTEKPVRAVPQSDSASFFYVFFPVFQDREPAPATATGEGFIVISDHYPPLPFRYFSISLSRIRYSCPDLPGSSIADTVPDAILRSTVRRCTPRALAASGTERVFGGDSTRPGQTLSVE